MKSLFGYEVPIPTYKKPLTAQDRANKLQERIRQRKEKRALPAFNPADFDLSSFPQGETRSAFIGQNLYIKPSYVVSMPEYCFFDHTTGEVMKNPRLLTEDFIKNQENLRNNDSRGRLSKKAVTGLRNSINWLCVSSRKKRVFVKEQNRNFFFQVNFITLTLPDTSKPITSYDLQKKLLNPFLTYMRQNQGLKNYVWRLEFQANGKLHVHLTTDSFLHHAQIRDCWNRLLDNHGYLDLYFKKHKHKNPNSTDVHATKKIKNMAAYLAKYMSKKNSEYKLAAEDKKKKKVKLLTVMNVKGWYMQRLNFWNSPFNPRPVKGRIWSCSTELSKANKLSVHVPANECSGELDCLMKNDIQYKEIFAPAPKNTNRPSIYAVPGIDRPKKIGEVFFLTANDWYKKMRGVIKDAYEQTRWLICRTTSEQAPVFVLT